MNRPGDPTLAAQAARVLRAARGTLHARPPAGDDELTRALEKALTAKQQRQRRRRVAIPVATAAALGALIWLGVRRPPESMPVATPALPQRIERPFIVAVGPMGADAAVIGDRRRPLGSGAAIRAGDRVASRSPLAMHVATGTRLLLRGELDVLEASEVQRFDLRTGSLDAEVAKLRPGERFVVRAGRAEIEVWGTAFAVSLGGDCAGPRTSVDVREGVVAVHLDGQDRLLGAGEHWRSPCPSPPARHRERAAVAPPPPPEPTSTLAEENALFFAAVKARQSGEAESALRLLGELLAKHPAGPLSEAAMAERMRLLRGRDAPAAAAAARAYLRRFPQGFARAEATALAPEAR
jgi:ferric-dicitrate binding protein FerR (iron transport regulator)